MVPEAPWWSEEHVRQIVAPLPDAPGEHPVLARRGWVASLAHDTAGEAVHGFLVLHSLHVGGTGEGEVESMVVDPAFRRRGLGRALMQSAADWCREHQVTVLRLEVRSRNSAAIALYRSASFVQTGIRHDYYASPPDDALLMEVRFC
jgi:ribosomal-protein-alanine N-acetyltransferase